jgi:sugar phosphate permease
VLWFGIRDQKKYQRYSGTINSFRKNIAELKAIIRNKQIWINGMYGCLVYLPTTVFAELWGIPYLTHAHGLSHESADFANSILFLGFTIGAPTVGYISDKIGLRKLPMFIGATGAAIVMLMILYLPNITPLTLNILMFLLGLLYSVQAIVFAVGRELSPKEAAGTAIAMTNMIVMIGAMFLQPLVGKILDWSLYQRTGGALSSIQSGTMHLYTAYDYKIALSIIPIGIIIAAFLTFFLRETNAKADVKFQG